MTRHGLDAPDVLTDGYWERCGMTLRWVHQPGKGGRPRLSLQFTKAQRRAGNAAYKRGDRTPEMVAAYREYQRVSQYQNRVARERRRVVA